MLKDVLRAVESQMTARLAEIRAKFTHAGDKGANAEEVFRAFLREYLPRRYAVSNGEVVDQRAVRSSQTDVVIVNDDHPFTFGNDRPGIFFVEGVSGAGEVKSVLNSQNLQDAIRKVRKFKSLQITHAKGNAVHTNPSDRERYYSCPPFFLFAFESELSSATILQTLKDSDPNFEAKPYASVDAVFILNSGWFTNLGDGEGALKLIDQSGSSIRGWVWRTSDSVLFDFLGWLSAVMPVVHRFEPIMIGYVLELKK